MPQSAQDAMPEGRRAQENSWWHILRVFFNERMLLVLTANPEATASIPKKKIPRHHVVKWRKIKKLQ